MTVTFIENVQERDRTPRGRGGTPRKIGYWQCGPLPKTLILFMSKICDFPYPIYDRPDQNFDNVFMTLVHSCLKHKFVKGFSCWLYLACVVGVKRDRVRQSADGTKTTLGQGGTELLSICKSTPCVVPPRPSVVFVERARSLAFEFPSRWVYA